MIAGKRVMKQSLFNDTGGSGRAHADHGNPKHQKLIAIAILAAGSAWLFALIALLVALFLR